MKVCVCSEGPDLESEVAEDIGHSPYFLVVETDDMGFEAVENEAAQWDMGAGMKAADIIIDLGVEAVICGMIGPHGYSKLTEAGITVSSDEEGAVREAIARFLRRRQ